MKVAIMQPYFFPYIGYFQLINAVDKFVIYDNIQFTKKGWVQRNRFLSNSKDKLFTIPVKKDSNFLDIDKRKLSLDFIKINNNTIRKFEEVYKKAPFFEEVFPLIKDCFLYTNHNNLFEFILYSINRINDYLGISTEILKSSQMEGVNHELKNKERVIDICINLGANEYINPIGGVSLYDKADFLERKIDLKFLQCQEIIYNQNFNIFIPGLSIIDVLMFNSKQEVKEMLNKFTLI